MIVDRVIKAFKPRYDLGFRITNSNPFIIGAISMWLDSYCNNLAVHARTFGKTPIRCAGIWIRLK